MDTKSLRVEVKDETKGEVTAVFSTFNVKDSDGDVTLPGAFADGAEVVISAYGHTSWEGRLPVGKGVIRTTKSEAVLDGQFFLDTAMGRDTFTTVKQLGKLGQWSYGYDVTDAEPGQKNGEAVRLLKGLTVHEVSPVLIGAGVNTRTLSAKSSTRFVDEAQAVVAALERLTGRAADVMAMRAEKGKGLSADSTALLERVKAQTLRLADLLEVDPDISDGEVEREYLRFLAHNRVA